MMLYKETIIEKYNAIQEEILHCFAIKWKDENCKTTFKDDVKKFYGFEKEFGWNILQNAFSLINDTELAKQSFKEFGLQGPSRHKDTGERYLRLYGVLNAAYQQLQAIKNLLEIYKISTKKEIISELDQSKLIQLRNKIGAHSANFKRIKQDSERKIDVFEISESNLKREEVKITRNQMQDEYFELNHLINIFDKMIENALSLMIAKVLSKIFNNQGHLYDKLLTVDKQKDGVIIIKNGNTTMEISGS